jgi:hypothetical protein
MEEVPIFNERVVGPHGRAACHDVIGKKLKMCCHIRDGRERDKPHHNSIKICEPHTLKPYQRRIQKGVQ